MAPYFSHPSSPESDAAGAAVESIISQAADLCALEQIAALNTSHFSDSSLPTDLETRFRKLKSFPGANPRPRTPPPPPPPPRCLSTGEESTSNKKLPVSSPDVMPTMPDDASAEAAKAASPAKPATVKDSEPKLRSGFSSTPSISRDSHKNSPSPPRQVGCFGCYPRRVPKKKEKGDGFLDSRFDIGDWGSNDDILLDLKDQRRKMKKMLKEQEKVNREAEKVVELVKKASARLNVAYIDELLSEDEEFK